MSSAGFETTILAIEWPQTSDSDRMAHRDLLGNDKYRLLESISYFVLSPKTWQWKSTVPKHCLLFCMGVKFDIAQDKIVKKTA